LYQSIERDYVRVVVELLAERVGKPSKPPHRRHPVARLLQFKLRHYLDFHTGRPLARRLGYDEAVVARMPESAIEAFAGVGNPLGGRRYTLMSRGIYARRKGAWPGFTSAIFINARNNSGRELACGSENHV
jgi:hypothetical protein